MKNYFLIICCICAIVCSCFSCSKGSNTKDIDAKYIKAWKSIYDSERKAFLGDDSSYKSLKYFSKPFKEFESNMDKLETDYFSGNKKELINDVYKSLPKDYFQWNEESVSAFFENVEDKTELEIRAMSFRTLVLHRLSYAYRSATYEVNSIRPVFVKTSDNEGVYGKFVLEGYNYLAPMIVVIGNDTLPYMDDFEDTPYLSKGLYSKMNQSGVKDATVYYLSWGDTISFDVSVP